LEAEAAACEYVRENCDCENANDDQACESQCYADAGLDSCEEVEGEEAFEVQRYLECAELENNNNNNNNNNYNYGNNNNYQYNQYFIGPYCSSDGKEIFMATFYDEGCTTKTTETDIYDVLFGKTLPYSKESIVKNDCISCKEVADDNGNNNGGDDANDADAVIEFCEELYATAGKCESNINSTYKDTSACDYINRILPRLETNSKSISSNKSSSSSGTAAKVFAWLFACTTLALGAYAFLLFRKLRRSKVGLANQGGLVDQGGELN
jgi:hypothetical protein